MSLGRLFRLEVISALFMAGGLALLAHAAVIAYGAGNRELYVTATVQRATIEATVDALGTVQPLKFVDVGTQITGQLKTINVQIGQHVEKGDLVAEIDPALLVARVQMTEAALQNAYAQLTEKLAQKELAEQLYARNQGLYNAHAASEELLQQSKTAADGANAQVEQLNAQIKLIHAQLVGDKVNLQYTKIFAPMPGTVVSISAREGQTLVATQLAPIILRIADLSTMTIWAQVSEADMPKIRLGMPAYFTPLGLPNRRWHGAVRKILPTPEIINNVVLYDVLFDVPNADRVLQPQMTALSSLVIEKADGALLVPTSALRSPLGYSDKADDDARAGAGRRPARSAAEQDNSAPQQFLVRVLNPHGTAENRLVTWA